MIESVFSAARLGDAAQLSALLAQNPALANTENSDGLTPLGFAAHFGQLEAVGALLQHGADINALSHSKISYIPSNTALHAAIAGERNLDVIRLLLTNHADANLFDSNGHTSLHAAALHADHVELIELLLQYGADVNARAEGGKSAVALATESNHPAVRQFLLEKGAVE